MIPPFVWNRSWMYFNLVCNELSENIEIWYDGQLQKNMKFTPENYFETDNTYVLKNDKVTDGKHTISLRGTGKGNLYYSVYHQYYSLEDPIPSSGLNLKISREYRLIDENKENSDEYTKRSNTENMISYKSGDLIEVVIMIYSKHSYNYVMINDYKPACFETEECKSKNVEYGI